VTSHKLFLRFLFSGGLFTALDIVLFYALLTVASHSTAYLLAYGQCVLLRYFWDSTLTFKAAHYSLAHLSRYIVANVSVLLLGYFTFQLASSLITPLWAKIASIPVTLSSGFIFTRFWVFKI